MELQTDEQGRLVVPVDYLDAWYEYTAEDGEESEEDEDEYGEDPEEA